MELDGKLFIYNIEKGLVAFETKSCSCNNEINGVCTNVSYVIIIPGLTDGLMSLPFIPKLYETLINSKDLSNGAGSTCWKLLQFIMTSSYNGYGCSSLDNDVDEILNLLRFLRDHKNANQVVLLGHSTGCQDIVHLFRRTGMTSSSSSSTGAASGRGGGGVSNKNASVDDIIDEENKLLVSKEMVVGVILQGPVSDRDWLVSEYGSEIVESYRIMSKEMISNEQGHCLLPRDAGPTDGVPMTANRFYSLASRLGLDDMFSYDLTLEELESEVCVPSLREIHTMIVQCANDEYLPSELKADDVKIRELLCKITKATLTRDEFSIILTKANHAISNSIEDIDIFCNHIERFLLLCTA